MAGLIESYASSLLDLAHKHGKLDEFYRCVALLGLGKMKWTDQIPEELLSFLQSMSDHELHGVMNRFLDMAIKELHIQKVKIVSAVPLKDEHLMDLERRLIKLTQKRIHIVNSVDESLIGGIRFVIGNMVVDNSIKTQLNKMKEEMYKGVYFKIESRETNTN